MGLFKHFLSVGAEPIATTSDHFPDFSDEICVVASRGPGGGVWRADKLYSCEDAALVANELGREWPTNKYWAAPATADEIKAHPERAARLMRSIARPPVRGRTHGRHRHRATLSS